MKLHSSFNLKRVLDSYQVKNNPKYCFGDESEELFNSSCIPCFILHTLHFILFGESLTLGKQSFLPVRGTRLQRCCVLPLLWCRGNHPYDLARDERWLVAWHLLPSPLLSLPATSSVPNRPWESSGCGILRLYTWHRR